MRVLKLKGAGGKMMQSSLSIGLRHLEEENNDVIKCDNFVEEGLWGCELVASKASCEMIGQKSDSFDIQDSIAESISGSKDVTGQNNDSLDMQVNEVESISGSNHDEEELMGHKSAAGGNFDIQGNL